MYKIETHLHTTYISRCGWLGAEAILKSYAKAGYAALCVTDHYNRECFEYAEIDIQSEGGKTDAFLSGFRRLFKMSDKYGIKIYEGAELRFDGSDNDYLLYGFHHELLENPDSVMKKGLAEFIRESRKDGALLIQAHPFRTGCTPSPAEYLDGVEVLNCNMRHNNSNEKALAYAKKHGLTAIAGSDCHRPEDVGLSGVLSNVLPSDGFEMAELLRSGNFSLISPEGNT